MIAEAPFDCAVSLSVIERIPENDIHVVLDNVRRALVPGGRLVLTLDLFLDVAPFEKEVENHYGRNVSVRWLVERSGLELVSGEPVGRR